MREKENYSSLLVSQYQKYRRNYVILRTKRKLTKTGRNKKKIHKFTICLHPILVLTSITLGTSSYANGFSFQKLLLPEVLPNTKSHDHTSSRMGEWELLPGGPPPPHSWIQ